MTSVDDPHALDRATVVAGRIYAHLADPATPSDSSGNIAEAMKSTAWRPLNTARQVAEGGQG